MGKGHKLRITPVPRKEPDLRKLARALLRLAAAESSAEAPVTSTAVESTKPEKGAA